MKVGAHLGPFREFLIHHYYLVLVLVTYSMVPTGTEKQGKPGKMGRHFPVREKSGNFVKSGKVREFCSKYWKNQKKLYWKIEKNTRKVKEICQSEKVGTMLIAA